MTVFKELKRRNVFKVATAYLITAWLIIQIVAVLEPHMNLPEWIVPVIIVFLVVGFPIACLFAWAFELTPEGIKRSKDVIVDDSISNITGRKIDFGIIAAMAIAVVFLTYEAYFSENNTAQNVAEINSPGTNSSEQALNNSLPEQVTSIAVLPFVNMSNDPEQEYFSDGLSEELLNVLARIKQLKVAARTSSFFFKNKNMDIKEIAEKLDVEHVLEGSVRKSGTKLRVTAQLIQADNGYHLWSATYDYELDDVFKIQDEISAAVVKQLKVTLLNEQLVSLTEHGTLIPEAQDVYLKGRFYMRSRTPDSLKKANVAFHQSLQIDPNNQLAVSGLVDTISLQFTYANLTQQEYLNQAKILLKPYLEKSENSAEMDTSIASYYSNIDDFGKAKLLFEQAIEKNTNYVQAYHWLAQLYRTDIVNLDNAKKYLEQAILIDPYSEIILISLFGVNYSMGNVLAAENYLNLLDEIKPEASHHNSNALRFYWRSGRDWQKAYEIVKYKNINKSQFNHDEAFKFYMALGMVEEARFENENILSLEAYQANIVSNYFDLAMIDVTNKTITQQQFDAFIFEKIIAYPHPDNLIFEVDIALRNSEFELAKQKIEQVYPHFKTANSLFAQERYVAIYYVLILNKLNEHVNPQLMEHLRKEVEKLEQYSKLEHYLGEYIAIFYSALGENQKAIEKLNKIYVENNYYSGVNWLNYIAVYDHLRSDQEFQKILKIANQKLIDKRGEFKNSQNHQAIYNTQ